jgi:putative transposase
MIVGMRTRAQAATVAALTGGVQLPTMPKPDGAAALSRYVDMGRDYEVHRQVVESVSVLFDLFDGDADSYAATGSPGVELPTGWMVTAGKFEVEWPAERDRAALVRSHFGARRFAFNWGLARVKADLDAKAADPGHELVGWDLGSLPKVWNRAKDEVAPWWAENSKEAYSAGLADLAQALSNGADSKHGHRSGRRVGFPRFKSARRDGDRVRFTTGAMRVEDDRRTITVPVIGGLRAKEEHPPRATPPGIGAGPDLERDAGAAVGPAVHLDRLRAAHTRHGQDCRPADGARRGGPWDAHAGHGGHHRHGQRY